MFTNISPDIRGGGENREFPYPSPTSPALIYLSSALSYTPCPQLSILCPLLHSLPSTIHPLPSPTLPALSYPQKLLSYSASPILHPLTSAPPPLPFPASPPVSYTPSNPLLNYPSYALSCNPALSYTYSALNSCLSLISFLHILPKHHSSPPPIYSLIS